MKGLGTRCGALCSAPPRANLGAELATNDTAVKDKQMCFGQNPKRPKNCSVEALATS